MTSEIDEFRKGLVAAVQAELERHASAVVAEVDRMREEGRRDMADMRKQLRESVQSVESVAALAEENRAKSESYTDRSRATIEQKIADAESRQTRRVDDVAAGIDGLVAEAVRPVVGGLKDDYDAMSHKVDGLDANLRKFDEQAARMVTYFNDVSSQMEARQNELSDTLKTDIADEVSTLKHLVEENDSAVRRFQGEVGHTVSAKINDAEDRFNNRLLSSESRILEETGKQIADIQVNVGRLSTGLDETMEVLNERVGKFEDRLVETDRHIKAVAESVEGIDQEALEALEAKMSTAAGEAMLVRIEMERLEKSVADKTDSLLVRMTDAETQLQAATMDVSTAVQLDRLEEIERSLLELDPNQFVRKDEASDESVKNNAQDADGDVGVSSDGYEI